MFRDLIGKLDNAQLLELFESEKSFTTQSFWQDRGPHFSEIDSHLANGSATDIGVFKGLNLVGATRLIPLSCRWPGDAKIYLDTDFFVHPQSRLGLAAGLLFNLRVRYSSEVRGRSIYFGIENKPHFMDQAYRVAKRFRLPFAFVGETCLTHLFLTSDLHSPTSSYEKISLKDCSDEFFLDFINHFNLFNENNLLSPIIELKLKNNILKFDPKAEVFFKRNGKDLLLGFLLVDMSRLRKFRWTPQKSLIRTKLNRRRQSEGRAEIQDNDIFLNKILALAWWKPESQSQLIGLIQNAIHEMSPQNYDGLILRDIDFERKDFAGLDILDFKRRIYVLTTGQDKENLEKLEKGEFKFRLEPLYL